MKYLAFRHPKDDDAEFVSAACRVLFGRDIYEMSDDELERYEVETGKLVAMLTESMDRWLGLKGRTRQVRPTIASPIDERFNDWSVYEEMEADGVGLPDRHKVMALCVLKAASEGNTSVVKNPGGKLTGWISNQEFADVARPNYLRGKKMDPAEARRIRAKQEREATDRSVKAIIDRDGKDAKNTAIASELDIGESLVSKSRKRQGI